VQRFSRWQRKVEQTTEQLNPCFAIGAFAAAMQPVDGTAPAALPVSFRQGGSLKRSNAIGTPWTLSALDRDHTGYPSGMGSRDQISGSDVQNINRHTLVPRLSQRRERTVED
jgi:hypothetical protein